MAHVYEVDSLTTVGNVVIVQGEVDNISVQVSYLASITFPSVLSFQAFVQPLMLAAAFPPNLTLFRSTWTA